jgi:hypothetical protein
VTLPIPLARLEPLAVGLDEVEDASCEFNLKAQIVFPSSRPNWLISRWAFQPRYMAHAEVSSLGGVSREDFGRATLKSPHMYWPGTHAERPGTDSDEGLAGITSSPSRQRFCGQL